jgi:hypothetical protein
MEKLKLPSIPRNLVSLDCRPKRAARPYQLNDPLPKISNRSTDVDIPRSVWSAWKEDGKPRRLRRPLTANERYDLEARRDELAPMLVLVQPSQVDCVKIALADMFGSFRSMRQTGADAIAILEGTYRALSEFPAWAIDQACKSIQQNGVWRDGKFDRQWPASDAEIVSEVRDKVRLYGDAYRSAVALLEADIEEVSS